MYPPNMQGGAQPLAPHMQMPPALPNQPTTVVCPQCQNQVTTSIKYVSGMLTWIIFGILMLCGCWLGCCLIPFCTNCTKNTEHYCPKCNAFIGTCKKV
ncbi:LITAF-like zinc ribbon domain-containing protein [Ditylenchus destructor]|uniref:LITAF-like zinc ribbon domain-containing protein n=1 Tax=Ditylenchus destructor TaxID=166010 RepID=A0AAD4MK18_9BILA|nr:LITAF-like zinc ribbon domain-containing protein [Ditylenchus destructor]